MTCSPSAAEARSPGAEIGCSSTLCCTGPGRGSRGAISPGGLVRGSRSSTGSRAGRSAASGNGSSRRSSWRSTKPDPSLMPRWYERTKLRRAEKGGPMQRTGSFSRRLLDQDPRDRRHEGQATLCPPHAGPAARSHRSGRLAAPRPRRGLDRRHGLRLGSICRCHRGAKDATRNLRTPVPQEAQKTRSQALPASLSRRGVLP